MLQTFTYSLFDLFFVFFFGTSFQYIVQVDLELLAVPPASALQMQIFYGHVPPYCAVIGSFMSLTADTVLRRQCFAHW